MNEITDRMSEIYSNVSDLSKLSVSATVGIDLTQVCSFHPTVSLAVFPCSAILTFRATKRVTECLNGGSRNMQKWNSQTRE